MRIARIQAESLATPSLALVYDGSFYDVAELETRWGGPAAGTIDFHSRVFGLRGAGLGELAERLARGERPTEARLAPGSFMTLAPCDPDRARLFQMAPYDFATDWPLFACREARALVGEQPVLYPPGPETPCCEAGIAAVLGEDLRRASPEEARAAVFGYCLMIAWTAGLPLWLPQGGGLLPTQLGPQLVTAGELPMLESLQAELVICERRLPAGTVGEWRFHVAESLSYLSHFVELRAGDVVGAGCLRGGAPEPGAIRFGDGVELTVPRLGTLRGSPLRGPDLGRWRFAASC
ncbi:MAG: fumarylacetoacetate hydrolase family protein [Deltaproteobacteria bacterium]|nr:fumarylacetoacetate hydrolase family protein [Deltaproteobacteria bacterium]